MKKIITTIIFAALIASCSEKGSSVASVSTLENDEQKVGYAYGMNIGEQVVQMSKSMQEDSLNYKEIEKGLNDFIKMDSKVRDSYAVGQNIGMSIHNFIKTQKLEGKVEERFVAQGLMDVLNGKETLVDKTMINDIINDYLQGNMAKLQDENINKGKEFLANKQKDSKVQATESGLLYEVIKEGSGEKPTETSVVEVLYVGKTIDGKVFDESKDGAIKFPLMNVIKGWQEGLQLMTPGSKYKLYIPSELGYGEYGTPDGSIEPNAVLEFEVELVSVE
ncbi:MAG TPA: FKBP-type peptidyl-prolyl cis-trans isomerase [Moheibacter sp.]|nr:FKBP-type peptidyl-prolyl cis-trans isomerase [Moheibacter sp.]